MNPSDLRSFESFDLNQLNEVLSGENLLPHVEEANEKEEDVEEEAFFPMGDDAMEMLPGSRNSSFANSESFEMMPVYRSVEVAPEDVFFESESGVDKVYEPPVLSRQGPSALPGQEMRHLMSPCDDLFAMLDVELAHTSLPSVDDRFCGIATTSFRMNGCLEDVSSIINDFLSSRGVHYDHFNHSSLWKCEVTNMIESCKFQIQLYSKSDDIIDNGEDYVVEFLRVSGSSLLFSAQYQHFKSENAADCEPRDPSPLLSDVSELTNMETEKAQVALEEFVNWVSNDQSEAIQAVCGMYSKTSFGAAAGDQLNSEEIMVMTLLGSTCMQCKEEKNNGITCPLPMLSLMNLLMRSRAENELHKTRHSVLSAMVDSLIPATARLTANSNVSKCVRETAIQMMDINCS